MAKILLIEDDFYLRRDLKQMLVKENHEIRTAGSMQEALQYLYTAPDTALFLVDLWLPDGDGFEILDKIRQHTQAPVLFLTACDDEQSVIRALESGADDYITKPFRKAELLSRIRANLRRSSLRTSESVLICGGLRLDPFRHEVTLDGEVLSVRPSEYRLLLFFMEHPGLLFSRERLQEVSAGDDAENVSEDNALNVQMSRLRKLLPKGMIDTVRGFGYRFTGDVRKV